MFPCHHRKGKKANIVRRLSLQAFTKKTQDDVAVDMGYDGNEMAKRPKKMELKVIYCIQWRTEPI